MGIGQCPSLLDKYGHVPQKYFIILNCLECGVKINNVHSFGNISYMAHFIVYLKRFSSVKLWK